jgi:hypothetical protein
MWDYFSGRAILDGHGTALLFIDDGARADQRWELEATFQGRKGGLWELLGGLITTWWPPQPAQVDEDVSEVLVCYSLGVEETQSNPPANRVIA